MGLRQLPAVDALARDLDNDLPAVVRLEVARQAVDEARRMVLEGDKEADAGAIANARCRVLSLRRPQDVINATGVLLHTNLGRAPLHPAAAEAAKAAAQSYGNVEFDLNVGKRGGRGAYPREVLAALVGAESAMIVNNNAAGLYLTLEALAEGLQVPVARGELIEIGGSYRLPELMRATGAHLVEIGTTNRTRISDYEAVLEVGLFLKVHTSNYRVIGFNEEVHPAQLSPIAARAGVPLVFDVGSGLLDEDTPWLPGSPPAWLSGEPGVRQSLERGCDLVLFSGDKLLGGPQAGLIVGGADLIARLSRHPVARAVRTDAPTLAALTTTLELYADARAAELPFWKMATLSEEVLTQRCEAVLEKSGVDGSIEAGESVPGAGSVPGATVPSPLITIPGPEDELWWRLLESRPPVVARRAEGRLVLDLRAVDRSDDDVVALALREVAGA